MLKSEGLIEPWHTGLIDTIAPVIQKILILILKIRVIRYLRMDLQN